MLTISFQTLAELELWTLASGWGVRRRQQVEHSSPALCRRWAEVMDDGRRRGRPIATADAWSAVAALLLDMPLITHNAGDYAGVSGLTVISEKTA